tara:strand:- start:1337 stop:1600 length:264 start_codon:yes stop_codon:yes gene_type:complete
MSQNKEDLKNKIIYRASYRGSKEMDILMLAFVSKIIETLDLDHLNALNNFINMDDETLIALKKDKSLQNYTDPKILDIINRFKKFKN